MSSIPHTIIHYSLTPSCLFGFYSPYIWTIIYRRLLGIHSPYVTHTLPLLWPLERQSYISLHTSSSFFFTHPLALPYGYIGKTYVSLSLRFSPVNPTIISKTTQQINYILREKQKKAAYKFIWKTYIYLFIFVVSSDEINTQEINLQVFFFFANILDVFFTSHALGLTLSQALIFFYYLI